MRNQVTEISEENRIDKNKIKYHHNGPGRAWMCWGLSPCVVAACVITVLIISSLFSIIASPLGQAP